MKGDVLWSCLKELGHVRLGEPDGFIFQPHLDAGAPVLGLVDEEFGFGRGGGGISHGRSPIDDLASSGK